MRGHGSSLGEGEGKKRKEKKSRVRAGFNSVAEPSFLSHTSPSHRSFAFPPVGGLLSRIVATPNGAA